MSFDNNQLCVFNVCNNLQGLGLNTTNISTADSPYTASTTDVVIFADATAGNITINLQDNPILPNQQYIIKKSDSTDNTVTIIPPVGQTINSAATYSLIRSTEIVQIIHDTATEWKIINDKFDRILTNKGDLYTHDGTKLVRLGVGADGTHLRANSATTTGLEWSAVSPSSSRVTYHLVNGEAWATSTTYTPIGFFPWLQSRHGPLTNGQIILGLLTIDKVLDVRWFDKITNTTITEVTGLTSPSDITSFPVANPTANAKMELQIRASGTGQTPPKLFGVIIEFDLP